MTTKTKGYYMVRSSEILLKQSLIGIGWKLTNFSEFNDANTLLKALGHLGRRRNEVIRFFDMQKDDVVVIPLPRSIVIGRIDGTRFFNKSDSDPAHPNQRGITITTITGQNMFAQINRDELSESFQRRLRVQGGIVRDLSQFAEEIEQILTTLADGKAHSWDAGIQRKLQEKEKFFKKELFDNIQSGRSSNLKAGGIGLEQLVTELLTIDGYNASVLSKKTFKSFADADIEASKEDRISTVNVLVQVKHHVGAEGELGIKQLEEIKNVTADTYSDYKLALVTSATVASELRIKAEAKGITVIDGKELVSWIYDSIDDLREETKRKLGICEIATIINK